MSRELLKEIAEVFRERRGGITWVAEPLLEKIVAYLAKPEPEPVAFVSGGTVNWIQPQATAVLEQARDQYKSMTNTNPAYIITKEV